MDGTPSQPGPAPADSHRPQQRYALAAACAVLLLLLAYRAYAPYWTVRPTQSLPSQALLKPLDPNRAARSELLQLPGVGPSLADAILSHRAEKPFRSLDDLEQVNGVGKKTLAQLWPHLEVNPLPKEPEPEPEFLQLKRPVTSEATLPRTPGKLQPGDQPINVNTASAEDLQRLPRIGPVLAQAILTARSNRLFDSVEDLRRVRGIGAKTLDALRPFITVE